MRIFKLDKIYNCLCVDCGNRFYFSTLTLSNFALYFIQCTICNNYDRVSGNLSEHIKRRNSISTDKTTSKCFKGWKVKSKGRWK
jgi:hypothetical protein